MNHLNIKASLLLALVLLIITADAVNAQDDAKFDRDLLKIQDQLLLKSGASLTGVIGDLPKDKSEPISFESPAGDSMLIDRVLISKIEKVDSVALQYNRLLDQMGDKAQSHRDMVSWCEEQERGRARFRSQILFHRKRILFYEPDDRPTRTKLGYTFLKDENRWVDKEQFWAQQGYNRQGDSQLFEETVGKIDQFNSQMVVKRKKLSSWQRNLRRMSHREAVDSLVAIADPQLMPRIYEKFSDTKDPALRAVYAETFATARPTTSSAIQGLVTSVMDDGSDIALDYLRQDDFNRSQVATFLKPFLGSKNNATIQRAAFALGELEAHGTILALSQVLQTKHQVRAATQNSGAQRVQGNAGGESYQFGGQSAKSVVVKNDAVLGALKKITGQDFGFSKKAYQKWYVQNYTHVGLKARR